MTFFFRCSFILLIFLLSGCSGISKYDDQEPAAIVKGQEITIGDLRFLYPDETALDYLDGTIKLELVKQKVQEMGLDITGNLETDPDWFAELPPKNTKDEGGRQIRDFAESQAKKLHMDPEEYQKEYARRINELNAHLITFLEEELDGYQFGDEKMNEEANQILEELVEENKEEINVLIKRTVR
ncbi:hypothetical protein CSV61_16520 [Sporosarcina sp. P3]|uniref:hypothetical protein n=1 Tax=Sporosarcina sp. P3 TaxID=2048245 RepID=UPI000C164389|nr:hypothetical protein [Sporosarcina sp. P3]PID20097.1 hypothetical protein CSV61_16520 [Sporosarcina sp. P3]